MWNKMVYRIEGTCVFTSEQIKCQMYTFQGTVVQLAEQIETPRADSRARDYGKGTPVKATSG